MNIVRLLIHSFVILLIFSCSETESEQTPNLNIIPQPQNITVEKGYFTLTEQTQLVYQGLDKQVLDMIHKIQNDIHISTGYKLKVVNSTPDNNHITFNLNPKTIDRTEAYRLITEPQHITLEASTIKGLFYAYQTLRNILPFEIETTPQNWKAPCLIIDDYPRFKHRGLNIDVARHFYPIDFIKKQLDLMAFYKINVFHWHLTDDQGWRIEIKKYPKLTSIGSKRKETLVGHGANPPFKYDNIPYSGYYSQEEIKELIQYASERHITIIPEIELPGHSLAALASYPELGCSGGPYEVATHWGSFDDVICAGKESSYQIIENILSEVAGLFPSEIIHIGGDECTKNRWRECRHCQQRIKANALKDENDLEHYFIKRIQTIVEKHGKKMAGWDEIMSDQSLTNATVVVCQDNAQFKNIINNRNTIIQSPSNRMYFDHYQTDPQKHPLAIGGYTPLKEVYCYEPFPDELLENELKAIKGVQANCWTEYMANESQLEFMLYPRVCALAELAWTSPKQKNWPDFTSRMEMHYSRLKQADINYFYEVPKPIVDNEQINFIQSTQLIFKNPSDNFEIYYTTDGSEPNRHSKLYTQAIQINSSGTIKAITINKVNQEKSKIAIINLNQLQFQKPIDSKAQKRGLNYTLYLGRFKTVKEIQNIAKSRSGQIQNTFIPDSIQQESFGIVYNGFISIDKKGIYQFSLSSDDGSSFYIGEKQVVNNDGIHGNKTESGAIALKKGLYPVKIFYFQTTGQSTINLQIKHQEGHSVPLLPKDFLCQ